MTTPPIPGAVARPGAHLTSTSGVDVVTGKKAAVPKQPADVRGMQQFLRNRGYAIAVDGILGPQTTAAAADWRTNRNPQKWNTARGASHTAAAPPVSAPAPAAPAGSPLRTTSSNGGGQPKSGLAQLLQNILNGVGAYHAPTADDLAKQAGQLADSELDPQRMLLQKQQNAATADAERRATFARDSAAALADVLKSQGPAVEDIYHHAGADQAALASGFSGDLRTTADNAAADTNALLASLGAPAGQMIGTDKSHDAANVLYGTGGYIPGTGLAREGAAFASAASELPQTATGEGERLAVGELQAGTTAKARLAEQLAALEAQRPSLVNAALDKLNSAAATNAGIAQNNALLPLLLAQKFEDFPGINPITGTPTKTQQQLTLQIGNQQVKLAQFDLSSRKTLAALTGYDPATGKATPETEKLLLAEWKAQHPAAKGGFTQHQLQQLKSDAGTIAHNAFYGVPGDAKNDALPPVTYQQAMKEMLDSGVPLAIAQQALNRYWTRPGYDAAVDGAKPRDPATVVWVPNSPTGGSGRPTKPFQLRVRRKGK